MTITNQKYEITDIAHEQYPFLHRIRALRDIGGEVRKGDLGGFVESQSNLSFDPGDDAWIFDEAIACNTAYVDQGAVLREDAVLCDSAYASQGAVLSGSARGEDDAYIRGAVLNAYARASGNAVILYNAETRSAPIITGHSTVYGAVTGAVRITGKAVVISGECIRNDTMDTLVLDGQDRSVIRYPSRDTLHPDQAEKKAEKPKAREQSR